MKKMLRFSIIILLALNVIVIQGALSSQVERQTYSITTSFTSSEPVFDVEDAYTTVTIDTSHSYMYTVGHPHLPKISKTIVLPFGSTITSVAVIDSSEEIIYTLENKIIPTSYPTPLDPDVISTLTLVERQDIYDSTHPYPNDPIEYSLRGSLDEGDHASLLILNWYPLQYHPQQNMLSYHSDISIEIIYSPPENPVVFSDDYDLVIIGPSSFAQEIQPLEDHKTDHGMNAVFTPVEEIYDQYQGRDHAEQIKYYLKDIMENLGITYALFIGNIDITPMRKADIPFWGEDDILTDLYYADIFCGDGGFSSWDPNQNGKYCEYNWDDGLVEDVDLYPDLYVGRLPCKDADEVATVVDKIITYETQTASEDWYHRILLLAGDTFPNRGVIEGEVVTEDIANLMSPYGFEVTKLWTSQNNYIPFSINREITRGSGFISYSGHGYEQGFGTSPPNVEQRIEYYSPYKYGIFNGDKLPVLFFDACSTTKLDFTIEDLYVWYPEPLLSIFAWLEGVENEPESYYPCISWELVKKANGGTIATIGATRVAFTGVDQNGAHYGAGFLNTHFFEAYEPGGTLAPMFASAQTDYLNIVGEECITLQEFNLIGDPSLRLGGYS